jgi:hypothetical protein
MRDEHDTWTDPQRAEKIKAVVALRGLLNTHGSLAWAGTERTALQRIEDAVALLEGALQGRK